MCGADAGGAVVMLASNVGGGCFCLQIRMPVGYGDGRLLARAVVRLGFEV